MRLGINLIVTDRSIRATRIAREAEAAGFCSLMVPEKTHVPTSRATPWPGGELPDRYLRCHDPFVALTAAAHGAEVPAQVRCRPELFHTAMQGVEPPRRDDDVHWQSGIAAIALNRRQEKQRPRARTASRRLTRSGSRSRR